MCLTAGDLSVGTIFSLDHGATRHVVQSWTLQPPGAAEPTSVTLNGTVDRRSGRLALSGTTADGVDVYVHATITAGGSRGISVGGDVMFNPQPEPPGRL